MFTIIFHVRILLLKEKLKSAGIMLFHLSDLFLPASCCWLIVQWKVFLLFSAYRLLMSCILKGKKALITRNRLLFF